MSTRLAEKFDFELIGDQEGKCIYIAAKIFRIDITLVKNPILQPDFASVRSTS